MARVSEEFRHVYLPYRLERVGEHGHVVLNRLQKPLGIATGEYVDYAAYARHFKGLGPATAARLSWNGSTDLDDIRLYADGCVPTRSADHWQAYQARLQVLAKLRAE